MDERELPVLSFKIEPELLSQLRKYCWGNDIKIKKFASEALQEKLNGKIATTKPTKRSK